MKTEDIKYWIPYWGPFLIESSMIDHEFVDLLREKGDESREKNLDHSKNLAGEIDNEYYYQDFHEWFVPYMGPYVEAYLNGLKTFRSGSQHQLKQDIDVSGWSCDDLWINYQKANEYNPPHHHTGDLSFVIYLQVPDVLKNEYELSKGQRKNSGPGTINFDLGVEMPCSLSSFIKLPQEGDVFIFPAWLPHYAQAFKSDVERISVSGNIIFKYDKI